MKTSGLQKSKSPSHLTGGRIKELGDGRREVLSRLRTLAEPKATANSAWKRHTKWRFPRSEAQARSSLPYKETGRPSQTRPAAW
jgi:hypothetical protein